MRRLGLLLVLLLPLGCLPSAPTIAPQAEATGVAGVVTGRDGAPVAGTYVYAYRTPRGGLRGPADFEALVGGSGEYFLDLVEGQYYLVARSRGSGGDAGPPRPGDVWALYPGNPVEVKADTISRIDLQLQGVPRAGLLQEGAAVAGQTGFRGRLLDRNGRPVPGAFVLGYRDQEVRRKPDASSPVVDANGLFTLYVTQPGNWCLAARTGSRGQPRKGELYGGWGVVEEPCREAIPGVVLDVGEIVLHPVRR